MVGPEAPEIPAPLTHWKLPVTSFTTFSHGPFFKPPPPGDVQARRDFPGKLQASETSPAPWKRRLLLLSNLVEQSEELELLNLFCSLRKGNIPCVSGVSCKRCPLPQALSAEASLSWAGRAAGGGEGVAQGSRALPSWRAALLRVTWAAEASPELHVSLGKWQ